MDNCDKTEQIMPYVRKLYVQQRMSQRSEVNLVCLNNNSAEFLEILFKNFHHCGKYTITKTLLQILNYSFWFGQISCSIQI